MIEQDGLRVKAEKIDNNKADWFTAIGTYVAEKGAIYTWTCKLIKGDGFCVGLLSNDMVQNHYEYWWSQSYSQGVALFSSLKENSDTEKGYFYGHGFDYGQNYSEGDVITVCLDLKQNKISYGRNETQFKAVPGHHITKERDYRLAISVNDKNTIIEIVSLNIEH